MDKSDCLWTLFHLGMKVCGPKDESRGHASSIVVEAKAAVRFRLCLDISGMLLPASFGHLVQSGEVQTTRSVAGPLQIRGPTDQFLWYLFGLSPRQKTTLWETTGNHKYSSPKKFIEFVVKDLC